MPLPAVGPGEELAAAASVARGEGGTQYVVVQSEREAMVGSVKGKFSPDTRLAGQLLASLIGADAYSTLEATDQSQTNNIRAQTLLYLGQHVGEQRVAVAVLHGVPVLDFVGGAQAVRAQAQGFIEKIVSGGMLLVQDSVQDDFEIFKVAAPSSCRVVDGLPFDAQWRVRTQPLRSVGISRARLAVVAATAGLVVAPLAYNGYRAWARRQMEEAAARRQALERVNAGSVMQRLQAEALGLLAQAAPAGHMAFDFARRLLDQRGGFALEKLQITPKGTLASYSRRDRRSTFTDFVTQADEGTPAFDVSKLDSGSVSYPPLAWAGLPIVDLAKPANGAAALLDLGTLAQRSEAVNIKLALSPALAVLTPEQLGRVDPQTLEAIGRKAGTWTASGPVDLFVPLMEALPQQVCTLAQVECRWSRDQQGIPADTFQAGGRWIAGWS